MMGANSVPGKPSDLPGAETGGYLIAHFREEPDGYAERIHFSLSDGDTPLKWMPLWGGRPVLTSNIGTTGVRDPAIARDDMGRFHILATDLRVFGGDGRGWDAWRRYGSRALIAWDSDDLVSWSGPRSIEVAPKTAGMAWAPEVDIDPTTGERIVFWSSTLFASDDDDHARTTYSRILFARTRGFTRFSSAEVLVDAGIDIIDTAVIRSGGLVHRFSKHEDRSRQSKGVFQEVGSGLFSDDFRPVAQNIGADLHRDLEAPVVIEDARNGRSYLLLDRYGSAQGYIALQTDDLLSGQWEPVPETQVAIPPGTKHGTVLRLDPAEWERLRSFV